VAVTYDPTDRFVHVRGASEHNLRNVDVDVPRDALVAFTGVSGSGKSSLAFGTLYAEAQRRYFESVAPYARRLLQQVGAPHVQEITGLPPAVALQQRRGAPSSRSTVGTLTTLSNLLRMLYSRAGTYPTGAPRLAAEAFSPNTAAGACPRCHGLGVVHDVTEELLVPDASLSIRDGAIAAWPGAWQGANLRSIVSGLGIDVDRPWRRLKKSDRDWLLFTEEQPSVLIKPERDRIDHGYYGKFWSARQHVMHVLADSTSERMRERALRFVVGVPCPECHGTGLRQEALAVTFAGRTIAEVNAMPFAGVVALLQPTARLAVSGAATSDAGSGGTTEVAVRLCADLVSRIEVLLDLGLGYLSLGRSSTTNSELPAVFNRSSTSSSGSASAGCRPADGSSSTYTTPNSPDRSWVAILRRCASPGDRVVELRPRERYPSPRSSSTSRRATTSALIRTATSVVAAAVLLSPEVSATGRSSAATSPSGSALTSAMDRPAKVTASESGRSRLPWQAGQGVLRTKRIDRSRIIWLLESASTCMTCLRALQNLP
jgi:hypothetical protein